MDGRTFGRIFTVGFVVAVGLVLLTTNEVKAKCSNATFCAGWDAVCKRTLPPGGSISVCRDRKAKCLTTGCYFFNVPRPRCKNNAEDYALTTSCRGT